MSGKKRKRFFLNHRKSSALVVSVAIHLTFIVIALTFVAVKIYVKSETTFEVKEINRPNLKLRKLQVPVKDQKKSQAPKLRKMIVAKPKTVTVDIKMPEIVGIKGGTGYERGGGLGGLGFGFDMDLFGGKRSSGNELMGTFYDLKQTKRGEPSGVNDAKFFELLAKFISSSWNKNVFENYFTAPNNKYAIAFAIPTIDAQGAPNAFGVGDVVKPKLWVAHYIGEIAAPETGRYRFCGFGDDVLVVRIKKRVVLDASWPGTQEKISGWKSKDENSGKFDLCDNKMVIGDWIPLQKGRPVEIEILIGERPGGWFTSMLLIEQEGREYQHAGTRPILPVFKTRAIPENLAAVMRVNPSQATLDGPEFGVLTNTKQPIAGTGQLP